ncbi:MAG: sigma-70 family RNA polymerase sigma factor [Planctomycetota bacterium]
MSPLPETRISLILRLAGTSDVQAWQEFADLYAPAVYGLAMRRGLQPADAEDVTQEVLFGVARAVERFEPNPERASFRTWLSHIARNMITDFLRRRSRKATPSSLDESGSDAADPSPSIDLLEEQAFESEYRMAVFQLAARHVRARVSDSNWQAFYRTNVQNEDLATVAESLGMPLGNLYVARSRIVKMLREETARLQQQYGEGLELQLAQETPLEQGGAS